MTVREKLAARLPDAQADVRGALLEEAKDMILAFTGRHALPAALCTAQAQLAAVLYNRMGIEGETAHSEGGVSRTLEGMPEEIRRQIAPYRLARIVKVSADETEGAR